MNRQTTLLTAVLAVGSLLLLAGCAKYKAMPLTQPRVLADKKGLTLEHKVFTKQDCQTYLGRKNLLKKGFQPIQLTITNNTDRSYTYSASSLSLPTVPTELVAKKVKLSTAGSVIGYDALAAASGATAYAILISHLAMATVIYTIPLALLSATGFFIAANTAGVKSHKANKELVIDFATKAFPREGILRPYQTVNGIVFVAKNNFNKDFTFAVNDLQTNEALILHSNAEYVDVK